MILSLGITPKSYFNLGGAANDADAQAFITAAGITNATQQSAVNQLVLDLKSANIWTKMKAIYPIVGGSASTHKWNLKDPRDLDAAFRLTFATGWTHSSTGMLPNGTSAYANTFIAGNTYSTNIHLSFYSRTLTVGGSFEIGCSDAVATTISNRPAVNCGLGGTTVVNYTTTTDARGFWIGSKRSNTDREVYRNGISENTVTTSITNAFPSMNIWIGGLNNNNSLAFASSKQCAFASIGDGLTDTEAANFYTAVNTYQTTLGRNV